MKTGIFFKKCGWLLTSITAIGVLASCQSNPFAPRYAQNQQDPYGYGQQNQGQNTGTQGQGGYGASQTDPYGGYGQQQQQGSAYSTPQPTTGYGQQPITDQVDIVALGEGPSPYGSTQSSYTPAPPATSSYTPAPATSSYTPAPSPSLTSAGRSHVVQSGETLYRISRQYGVSVDQIRSSNGIAGNLIRPGEQLMIP